LEKLGRNAEAQRVHEGATAGLSESSEINGVPQRKRGRSLTSLPPAGVPSQAQNETRAGA
jgi:hypothetical protein